MKIVLPLFVSMVAPPFLKDLITNYMVHTTAKSGKPAKFLYKQEMEHVSKAHLLTKRKILEVGNIHRRKHIQSKLEKLLRPER